MWTFPASLASGSLATTSPAQPGLPFRGPRWGERPGQGVGWREARGELTANQGSIGVNLLQALAREMKFRLAGRVSRLDPRKTETEFRSLGLAFNMQPSGEIHLTGRWAMSSVPTPCS